MCVYQYISYILYQNLSNNIKQSRSVRIIVCILPVAASVAPDGWTAPNMFAQAPAPRHTESPEQVVRRPELPTRGPYTYGFVPMPWTGFRSRASTTRTSQKFWN